MGEFYSELQGEIDSLAEKFIAQGGTLSDAFEETLTTTYDEFAIVQTLDRYRNMVASSIDQSPFMAPVADGLGDIMELIDAKLYKFKLK